MNTILEDLWYGNIDQERANIGQSKEVQEIFKHMGANRERLDNSLTKKQRKLLVRYDDCIIEMNSIIETEIFSYAFRLGGKLMLATLMDNSHKA